MTDPVQIHHVQMFCCNKCGDIHLNGIAEDVKTVVARLQMEPSAALNIGAYLIGLALAMTGGSTMIVEAVPLIPTPTSVVELQEMTGHIITGENDGGETKH
ncbi:MAG TPA: hypothetical protein VLJ17_24690 [Xanthobacteraceae bacterium]|nr:hypothetical protein [Xanthobacteraceae bacterium]